MTETSYIEKTRELVSTYDERTQHLAVKAIKDLRLPQDSRKSYK
jgi:hypothetical protein